MYLPKVYWTNSWFNHAIDNLQSGALRRALSIAEISPGSRILDVGCGTGRCVRRFGELGFSPIGVDATSWHAFHRTTAP